MELYRGAALGIPADLQSHNANPHVRIHTTTAHNFVCVCVWDLLRCPITAAVMTPATV